MANNIAELMQGPGGYYVLIRYTGNWDGKYQGLWRWPLKVHGFCVHKQDAVAHQMFLNRAIKDFGSHFNPQTEQMERIGD